MKSAFMTEEEYKADIYELFSQFDFDTAEKVAAGEEVPVERQTIDFTIFQMIFKALGKPIDKAILNKIEKELNLEQLNGVSYPIFERRYLIAFPYDSSALLDETLSVFDRNKTGYLTIDDMKRVVNDMNGSFSDADLESLIATYGKDGKISIAAVRNLFC